MANGFLRHFSFRPTRKPLVGRRDAARGPLNILPADDILDFAYPPESRFSDLQEVDTVDENLFNS